MHTHINSRYRFKKALFIFLITAIFPLVLFAQDAITMNEYKTNKLYNVVKVSSENNTIIVQGYCMKTDSDSAKLSASPFCQKTDPDYETVKITLKESEVLHIGNRTFFYRPGYMQPLPISVTTIPIKVRLSFDGHPNLTTASLSNLGLNLNLIEHRARRYFADGNLSTHRSGIGVFMGPSVEQIDSTNVKIALDENEESKQLFISTGLTLTYAYNNISFTLVPLGIDFATSSVGKKFRYDKKVWFGFGIGIRPDFFNWATNK